GAVGGRGGGGGAVARKGGAVEDEVDALAGGDHWGGGGVHQTADGVAEGARGIDDDLGLDAEFLARLLVTGANAVDVSLGVAGQGRDLNVVEKRGAMFGGGGDEVDEQAGVVELAVVVDDAAA